MKKQTQVRGEETRERILEVLQRVPSANNRYIAAHIGMSITNVVYHINELSKEHKIEFGSCGCGAPLREVLDV